MKTLYLLPLLFFSFANAQDFQKIRDSLKSKYKYIGNFKQGYAPAVNKQNKFGIIDSSGSQIIPLKYDNTEFANGLFIVKLKKHYGLYNLKNEQVLPIEFDWLLPRKNNLFLAMQNNRQGVVNTEGNTILPLQYGYLTIYNDKYIITRNKYGGHTLFNLTGKQIQPFNYKIYALYNDVAFCADEKNCYLVNLNNLNDVKPLEIDAFEEYGIIDYEQHGYRVYKKDNKYGLISYEGEILIPAIYSELSQIYATGNFIAKAGDKFGLVDFRNEVILPFDYLSCKLRKEWLEFKDTKGKDKIYYINFKRVSLP